MSRNELINYIDDWYTNSDYWEAIEDIICHVIGIDNITELSDEDEDEGFYANFDDSELEEIVYLIKDEFDSEEYTLNLTKKELSALLTAMETFSDKAFTKDSDLSFTASRILDKLESLI